MDLYRPVYLGFLVDPDSPEVRALHRFPVGLYCLAVRECLEYPALRHYREYLVILEARYFPVVREQSNRLRADLAILLDL